MLRLTSVLAGLGLAQAAWAMPPTFVADQDGDADQVRALWEAAEACTGRDTVRADVVRLMRRPADATQADRVEVVRAEGVLTRLMIAPDAQVHDLAWGVAGAWFDDPLAAAQIGRTALLSACISHHSVLDHVPGPDPRDAAYLTLPDLPDLRTWAGPPAVPTGADRSAAWASVSLFTTLGRAVPRRRLLTQDPVDLQVLQRWMTAAGPLGEQLAYAVSEGATGQQRALRDRDGDGLADIKELFDKTDPRRWDSGDTGWWDDAPSRRHAQAVPLAPDGSAVCVPWMDDSGPAPFPANALALSARPSLLSTTPTVRKAHLVSRRVDQRGATASSLTTVDALGHVAGPVTPGGGAWVEPTGPVLPSPLGCHNAADLTLTASHDRVSDGTFHRFLSELTSLAAPSPRPGRVRLVVHLGGEQTLATRGGPGARLQLSDRVMSWAHTADRQLMLSLVLYAWRDAASDHRALDPHTIAVALLAQAGVPQDALWPGDPSTAESFAQAATRCATGWGGLADGSCSL